LFELLPYWIKRHCLYLSC